MALAKAALLRTTAEVVYDGSYHSIAYPGGDVPAHIGVCTDVVIRAYRTLGTDLQQLVHEDMQANFAAYPAHWGLRRPDSNIDHRRVPNLEVFFSRHGQSLPVAQNSTVVVPGDIVSFRLDGRLPHVGIVGHERIPGTGRFYVIHNIGAGPRKEDVLSQHPLYGHYRYAP